MFPLSELFSFSDWRSRYSKFWHYDPAKLELIDTLEQEVIKKFEHYQIPAIQLRDCLPKEAVCQVFEDTNTAGCDLNYFDLMSSSYCAGDFSLRDDWKLRESRLRNFKVLAKLRNTDFVQAVTLVSSYTRRVRALSNGWSGDILPAVSCGRAEVLKLSKEDYQTWADPVTRGFEEAARFLYGLKLFAASDIAYPIQLVALAAIFSVLGERSRNERVRSQLEQWFWSGLFGEMYTRWSEGRVAHDILEVPLWISNGPAPSTIVNASFSAEKLRRVRKRFGAVYQGLTALLRRQGAIDLHTGEAIDDVIYFEEQINSHHIFPVSWCRKQGIDAKDYNCLLNRTPISATTNKKISAKPPSVYLREFEESGITPWKLERMLHSHAIEPRFLYQDDFEGFMAARTEALLELIGKAMGRNLLREYFEQLEENSFHHNNGKNNGIYSVK